MLSQGEGLWGGARRRAQSRRPRLHEGDPGAGRGGAGKAWISGCGLRLGLPAGRGSEQHLPAVAGSGSRGSATSEGRGLRVLRYSSLQRSGRRGPDALPQSCGRLAGGEGGWRGSRAMPEGRPPPTSLERDTIPWMACLSFPSCKMSVTKLTALVPR